jgi:hypothetical protein
MAAFAPDGRLVAAWRFDGTDTRITFVSTQQLMRAVGEVKHAGGTAAPETAVVLLETATGQERVRCLGPSRGMWAACVSLDGRLAAACYRDGKVRLWDAETGAELKAPRGDAARAEPRGLLTGHRGEAVAVCFSPDGKLLASAGEDRAVVLWDVAALRPKDKPLSLGPADLEALWADLAGDAGKAHRALVRLRAGGAGSVALLRRQLRPAEAVPAERLAKLLDELDDRRFAVRDRATAELERLGDVVEAALRKRLAGPVTEETRRRLEHLLRRLDGQALTPERLRSLRAVELLERLATAEARTVLRELAAGVPEALLTREAAAALGRLPGE